MQYLICDAVSQFNDGVSRKTKSFIKYGKRCCNKVTTKCKKQCQMLQLLRIKKNSHTNYRFLASTTHILPTFKFFVVIWKLLRKSSIFSLLRVAQILYMLIAFKKSNKLYFVQATKIIKSKDAVKDQILQTITTYFRSFFKF